MSAAFPPEPTVALSCSPAPALALPRAGRGSGGSHRSFCRRSTVAKVRRINAALPRACRTPDPQPHPASRIRRPGRWCRTGRCAQKKAARPCGGRR